MKKALWSLLILSMVAPLLALGQEKKQKEAASEQTFLQFKPRALLPSYTNLTSSNTKLVLRDARVEGLLLVIAPGELEVTLGKGTLLPMSLLAGPQGPAHSAAATLA